MIILAIYSFLQLKIIISISSSFSYFVSKSAFPFSSIILYAFFLNHYKTTTVIYFLLDIPLIFRPVSLNLLFNSCFKKPNCFNFSTLESLLIDFITATYIFYFLTTYLKFIS